MFHSAAPPSDRVNCREITVLTIGGCLNSMVESCRCFSSGGYAVDTCFTSPSRRLSLSYADKHARDRWGLLRRDGKVLPKSSQEWKRGLHVFPTTAGTSGHLTCKVSMIRNVGRCLYWVVESRGRVLSSGTAADTCFTARSQRLRMLNAR